MNKTDSHNPNAHPKHPNVHQALLLLASTPNLPTLEANKDFWTKQIQHLNHAQIFRRYWSKTKKKASLGTWTELNLYKFIQNLRTNLPPTTQP